MGLAELARVGFHGGQAGALSPFALVGEVRKFFSGPLALSGSIATGAAAAQVLTSSSELKHQSAALRSQVDDFLNHVRKAA